MKNTELKKGIYAVGAVDWDVRNFHGYTTNRGTSYNAYLIVDEKTALIDTVKKPFAGELLKRISNIIPLERLDYIISNHVEMDHSGALPDVAAAAPNARIITSDPNGLKGLLMHYGKLEYDTVKTGDSISLGGRTLQFTALPMVHWPDSMATYCPEEKLLFPNDAFGQHYASSSRFDDEVNMVEVLQEAAKYYANIVLPFGMQTQKALKACSGLEIDMIAPSHGVIWRRNVDVILDKYARWSTNATEEKGVILYDSMWHSTEMMARSIVEGFAVAGVPCKLMDLKVNDRSDIMAELLEAKYICVGSPTLNNTVMPTVAAMLNYMKGLAPKRRAGLSFGSYGWSGQSVGIIEDALFDQMKLDRLCGSFRLQYVPSEEQLAQIEQKVAESLGA